MNLSATSEANALLLAARWVSGVLTGPVATSLAVISIASLGYLMLSGRLDLRRGARIVLGCFIVFGAPALALGFRSATQGLAGDQVQETPASMSSGLTPLPRRADETTDPYAGAAVRR